ncbi:hypothetical protein ABZ636_39235 [Streptomyces sp. NPDC007251]|uniref:hypothetical protein n=1 Tax=unclassified Streptomyces TaxID=2593676 RepID=UPI0033C09206
MPSARRRSQLLLAALAAGVLSAGCSASGDARDAAPSASAADAQEVAYYRCLEDQGLALEVTDGGELRVDKDKAAEFGYAKEQAAEAKCRGKLPHGTPSASAPAAALEAARKQAECFRKNGVPDYPDPDPKTAEIKLSDELAAKVKRDFADVAAKCSPADGPGIVGG